MREGHTRARSASEHASRPQRSLALGARLRANTAQPARRMASCEAPAAVAEAEAEVEVMEFAFGDEDDVPLRLVSVRQVRGVAPSRRMLHVLSF